MDRKKRPVILDGVMYAKMNKYVRTCKQYFGSDEAGMTLVYPSMSSSLKPAAAAIVAATNIQIGRYITVAIYVIQVSEWLASLEDEWSLIHCSRWTSVKFAYLCCRYYPLLCWPFAMWAFVGNHEDELCQHVVKLVYIMMIPYQLSAQAVMTIRAWAFAGRQAIVFAILVPAYVVLVGLEIWVFATDVEIARHAGRNANIKFGCIRSSAAGTFPIALKTAILLISCFSIDFLCTLIITVHCIRLRSLQGSLGKTFLTQGLGAFVLMSVLHIASAVIAFISIRFGGGLILPLPLILSNIVACRLQVPSFHIVSRTVPLIRLAFRRTLSLRKHVSIGTETEQSAELSRVVRNAVALSKASPVRVDNWAY